MRGADAEESLAAVAALGHVLVRQVLLPDPRAGLVPPAVRLAVAFLLSRNTIAIDTFVLSCVAGLG